MSDHPTDAQTFAEYGERFQIEEGFLDEKSGLFEREDAKLRDAASLERLILMLALATVLLVSEGVDIVQRGDRRAVDPHWRRALSYLKIGHRAVLYALSRGQMFFTRLALPGGPDPESPRCQNGPRSRPSIILDVSWTLPFRAPS
ncbi:hypothetical protein [Deinococcus sedimenti]|uniref:hypothetical protein n=1 Tax=Deinococcus sedimenti TaxID=1867090 RepID=UPI001663513F|nr:hypothetical protein [Deinococcus sedimenti]